jgi:Conjugal transfer protein TraD
MPHLKLITPELTHSLSVVMPGPVPGTHVLLQPRTANELAGALIALAETKDTRKMEAWAKRGVSFFQGRARRNATASDRDADGAPAQPDGTQPASGGTGTA